MPVKLVRPDSELKMASGLEGFELKRLNGKGRSFCNAFGCRRVAGPLRRLLVVPFKLGLASL